MRHKRPSPSQHASNVIRVPFGISNLLPKFPHGRRIGPGWIAELFAEDVDEHVILNVDVSPTGIREGEKTPLQSIFHVPERDRDLDEAYGIKLDAVHEPSPS